MVPKMLEGIIGRPNEHYKSLLLILGAMIRNHMIKVKGKHPPPDHVRNILCYICQCDSYY